MDRYEKMSEEEAKRRGLGAQHPRWELYKDPMYEGYYHVYGHKMFGVPDEFQPPLGSTVINNSGNLAYAQNNAQATVNGTKDAEGPWTKWTTVAAWAALPIGIIAVFIAYLALK